MNKLRIKEVIVVEGKHDQEKILKCVDADIIVTNGTHLSKDTLDLCKRLNQSRGILVFTDPDGPGEYIRRSIIDAVGSCKHASLHLLQSKRKGKVGIEHASCEDIIEALQAASLFSVETKTIEWSDFLELGLSGKTDSQQRRDLLSTHFKFPKSNAKTCFKYLNMMGIKISECETVLKASTL